MSDKFTKENLIKTCLDSVFENNCIRHLRCRNDWPLGSQELSVSIKGKDIVVTNAHREQSEIRFNFVLSLIKSTIENYNLNLDCNILIATHDAVGPNQKYTRLCFAESLESNHIQIPDPHIFFHIKQIQSHLEKDTPFADKEDKISFFGSDTGALDEGLLNQRIRFCNSATIFPEKIIAKITNFVHFKREMIEDLGILTEEISAPYTPISEQLKYKYLLDIDGNASSWDRTPWGMASNSYLIHLKSTLCKEVSWYYPFIKEEGILPIVSGDDVLNFKVSYNEKIKAKQKVFASIILNQETQLEYMKGVLERYNELYNQ